MRWRLTALSGKQAGVAAGMAAGLAITVGAFVLPSGPGPNGHRLALWSACSLAAAFWLALGVALLARFRFFSTADIDGQGLTVASPRVALLQALIQNTLEQSTLAIAAYGAWLLVPPRGAAGTVVACACLFCVGRLLFFIGYARGAAARSLGFALTFYPTVGLIVLTAPRAAAALMLAGQGR
jgi:uncharacterized MAPEG superfamily protein